MHLSITQTRCALGIYAQPVSVEVHLSNGIPGFAIVGLAETAVKESKDRVRSAIINSQFEFPYRKITVNLAPANLPKSGSGFDLPIALGILAASQQIPNELLCNHEFIGELALSGDLRAVSAIIPAILGAKNSQNKLVIPCANANEAALFSSSSLLTARSLSEVCAYIKGQAVLQHVLPGNYASRSDSSVDWSDIKGQKHVKFALEIAAIGGHSVLLSGPPGSGKTMLAKRFSTLLPNLTETQAFECAALSSLSGNVNYFANWLQPPFRAPHHTATPRALTGGGNPPKPGEISLAHNGVLFLDEVPEFQRCVLESLREPMESGHIMVSRAAHKAEFPASFQLIAAMNPCPCGHWGNSKNTCYCPPDRITRYINKISGPLLDRIDMHINVQPLGDEELMSTASTPNNSFALRQEVEKLRTLQLERQGCLNSSLSVRESDRVTNLGDREKEFLHSVISKLQFSARSFQRLLKVSRSIADREGMSRVELPALQQALSFKQTLNRPI